MLFRSNGRTIKRSDSITSWNSVTREAIVSGLGVRAPSTGQLTTASTDTSVNTPGLTSANESAISVVSTHNEVKTPESGASPMVYDRNWESELESVLKVWPYRRSPGQGLLIAPILRTRKSILL